MLKTQFEKNMTTICKMILIENITWHIIITFTIKIQILKKGHFAEKDKLLVG